MSDDCLYLNVWSPNLEPIAKLPVMVWIHGGSHQTGLHSSPGWSTFWVSKMKRRRTLTFERNLVFLGFSNYYDGTAMAAREYVVFVSINYRVGAFGELCRCSSCFQLKCNVDEQVWKIDWGVHFCCRFSLHWRPRGEGKCWFAGSDRGVEVGSEVHRPVWRWSRQRDRVRWKCRLVSQIRFVCFWNTGTNRSMSNRNDVLISLAGSISISHLIVSALSMGVFRSSTESKSLFRRAICQSGVSLHPGSCISPQQARKFLLKRLPDMGKKTWNFALFLLKRLTEKGKNTWNSSKVSIGKSPGVSETRFEPSDVSEKVHVFEGQFCQFVDRSRLPYNSVWRNSEVSPDFADRGHCQASPALFVHCARSVAVSRSSPCVQIQGIQPCGTDGSFQRAVHFVVLVPVVTCRLNRAAEIRWCAACISDRVQFGRRSAVHCRLCKRTRSQIQTRSVGYRRQDCESVRSLVLTLKTSSVLPRFIFFPRTSRIVVDKQSLPLYSMFYRGHKAGNDIVKALVHEYLGSAADDITLLTQGLVEMYGDILFVAPTTQKVLMHSGSTHFSICRVQRSWTCTPCQNRFVNVLSYFDDSTCRLLQRFYFR